MTLPVVGIGASAGGLEVMKALLRHLPVDTGLAFVFIQYLDPKHHSNLSEILSRVTAIPVHQAADGMKIEPNHVYVIPPDAELEIVDQLLRTTPRRETWKGSHKPIDLFLRSLAQECGARAICVILSGAGADGAAGLEAVKAGGVTLAQDPAAAEFDGMPRTAAENESVDFVLSPEAIAAELVKLSQNPYFVNDADRRSMNPGGELEGDFGPILKLLRDAAGVDFSLYRSTNEELRSLNEELETAKEELQSTNEELAAINAELRAANTGLVEARDFARLVVETVASPLVVLDTELRLQTANPAFYRMFKISPRDAEGQFFYSLTNGCWDIPIVRDMLDPSQPDPKSLRQIELDLDFPVIGKKVLVLSARRLDGLQQFLIGIEDVTLRQQRAEAALHESEERFRNMADTAPVMIWVSGQDGARSFFNRAWLAFTGHTMEEELGNGWTEGVHPDDLDRGLTAYYASFSARRAFQINYRLRRADGEYRWLLDNGVPRLERGGAFVGYIGSCIDITDLKQRQEENLARQKLETVGTLATGIAHDFNNLLGGVLSQSELALAELAAGSRPEEELKRIQAVAIRGSEIVRQLMIYAGKETEVLELIDVSSITEEMLELLKASVSKTVGLETDLGKDLPAVRATAAQVRQVVMNLITNASEAIGDRKGVIRITTRRVLISQDSSWIVSERLGAGEYLKLEVSDSGRGMAPETQARVFDPFFTTKSAGRGLGLAVVHGIVRSLRGAIRLISAPGAGSTFQILLPCAGEAGQSPQDGATQANDGDIPSRTATILIVEDEALLLEAAARMVRRAGFTAIEANDGSAGLDVIRARHNHIDVLLLDLTLPGTASREVFEEASRLRPEMRVIVTSAYTEAMAAASLGSPVERFIRKPYRLGDLMALIRQALTRRHSARAPNAGD